MHGSFWIGNLLIWFSLTWELNRGRHLWPASLESLLSIHLPNINLLSVAAEPPEWPHCAWCSDLHIVRASDYPMWTCGETFLLREHVIGFCHRKGKTVNLVLPCSIYSFWPYLLNSSVKKALYNCILYHNWSESRLPWLDMVQYNSK